MELRPLPHPEDYTGKPDYPTLRRLVSDYRTFVGDAAAFRIEYRHWPGDFRSETERERFEDKEQWEWPTAYETLTELHNDLAKEHEVSRNINRSMTGSYITEMDRSSGWRTAAIALLIPYLLVGAFFIYFG